MDISNMLDNVDSGYITLPKFQRGYVWNREQIRKLFASLYRRHPVGSLLLWTTESESAQYRGDGNLSPGVVRLLLDGQQRVTTLYAVIKGVVPSFFDGDPRLFQRLHFNVETEEFEFYQPVKMRDDSHWIDVTNLMQEGHSKMGEYIVKFASNTTFLGNINTLLGIKDMDILEQSITGARNLDEIVSIFTEINKGGTKLSKGDLALARICADWPDARERMKTAIANWGKSDYSFTLDWLLRSMNTILTNSADFQNLQDKPPHEIEAGMSQAIKHIEAWLNRIDSRLGIDHDRVLFGRYAFPVLARYSAMQTAPLSAVDRDKLLFWFVQSGMWGRFSSSIETTMNEDLRAIDREGHPIDNLLDTLRRSRGNLSVNPENFDVSTLGARFYPVLYMLTRTSQARDLCSGLELKKTLLGSMSKLEVHHIFPKSQLYNANFRPYEVNALANFALLTKESNLHLGNSLPENYFPEMENRNPGVLQSQWIPNDPRLWKIENYLEFLSARRELLAAAANDLMRELLNGDERWLTGTTESAPVQKATILGNVSDSEEAELQELNDWLEERNLPPGQIAFDLADSETDAQLAVFDIAWPDGLQPGFSEPVTLLLNADSSLQSLANEAGYKCFTNLSKFKNYVTSQILHE